MFNARIVSVDKTSVDNEFLAAAFPDGFQTTIWADNNRGLFFCFPFALGPTGPLVHLSRQALALFRLTQP